MAMHWEEQTYYDVLEINPQASDTDVRMAYQRAKSTYSQDNPALYSVFTKDETRQLLSLIEEAYNVLSNQVTRRAYDLKLLNVGGNEVHPADEFLSQAQTKPQRSSDDKTSPTHSASSIEPSKSIANDARELGPVRTIRDPSSQTPSGHGKSFVGVYPLNASIEDSIASETLTDGHFLKKVREYKKVELDQLSERTRISKTYLTAVEANDYSNLPAPVFVRGFIIQVARALGIDETKAAKGYMEHMKTHKPS